MDRPLVLRSALGDVAPLLATDSAERAENLPLAAAGGFIEPVRLLLKEGVEDVNRFDASGQTALMNAAQGGHLTVAHELLTHGAGVHIKKNDGFDALLLAANGGHPELVQLLIDFGASPTTKDAYGRTALHLLERQEGPRKKRIKSEEGPRQKRTRRNSLVAKVLLKHVPLGSTMHRLHARGTMGSRGTIGAWSSLSSRFMHRRTV